MQLFVIERLDVAHNENILPLYANYHILHADKSFSLPDGL